jgi:hypothetical protein
LAGRAHREQQEGHEITPRADTQASYRYDWQTIILVEFRSEVGRELTDAQASASYLSATSIWVEVVCEARTLGWRTYVT